MKRFSANLGFLWVHLDLLQRIESAGRAGFGAVELHWPYDTPALDVRQACVDAGVELLSLNSPLGDTSTGEFGLAVLSERREAFQESFLKAADYVNSAGARALHVMAGLAPNNASTREVLIENLRWAEAQAPGLTILLEPLNNFDKPGYFYHLPEQAVQIINDGALVQTKLMFDAYHVGREGLGPEREYKRFAQHIAHIQIAAVPHRMEPYGGQVDLGKFLSYITEQGYDGFIGCEYIPERTVEAGLERLRQFSKMLG